MQSQSSQREQAQLLLARHGMLRLSELTSTGITSATISRMERDGHIVRLHRGLYQLANAEIETHHSLAEAVKWIPRGVVCLTSALSYHELTDQLPRRIWMAIGKKDWVPLDARSSLRIVRFTESLLEDGVDTHIIENVSVRIFNVPKTIADCFRHRGSVGLTVAIEGLQQALRQRKARPAEIADYAQRGRVWTVMRPYLEALTANG